MNSQGYAVVDFETTGLSPAKGDRAIEIGLVHVAPDGTLEDEHETLIHVDRSVGASWVHHITARELLHAPDFEGIAHELRDLLAGRVFVHTTCRSIHGSYLRNTRVWELPFRSIKAPCCAR